MGSNSGNIAIGDGATAVGDSQFKVAIGYDTDALGTNAVAMGFNAQALGDGSVAIGAGSIANEDLTFAVGSSANRRRIVNVGDGIVAAGSSDAVTGGQLFTTNQRIGALEADNGNALGVAQDARQRADNAQATANTALGTANGAQSTANVALEVADTALANAATAQQTADTALGNAATAQATADTAREEAASAQQTADRAEGKADAAQETADLAIDRGDSLGESVAQALGGGATYDAANAVITAPSYGIGGVFYNNVGDALNAIDTTGTRHFRTDGSLGVAQATGVGSTAMGGESVASGDRSTAAGAGAQATGASSVAMGDSAQATADGAIAVGLNSAATGTNAIAIGAGATATGSVAVGAGASAANGGAAFGDGAVATGLNATATGPNAQALADNSVAIGAGSVATQAGTVSVGAVGAERRITNVAAGTAPTDAVNVGQLGASGASVAAALGGGATASATGVVTRPSYALAMGTFDNVGGALDGLSNFALESRREARRGIASAIAMSPAPMPSQPGRTSYTFNVSEFNGASAIGGSVAHRFNSRNPFALTAGYSRGGSENAFRVGVAGEF